MTEESLERQYYTDAELSEIIKTFPPKEGFQLAAFISIVKQPHFALSPEDKRSYQTAFQFLAKKGIDPSRIKPDTPPPFLNKKSKP